MSPQRLLATLWLAIFLGAGGPIHAKGTLDDAWQAYGQGDYQTAVENFSNLSTPLPNSGRLGLGLALQQLGKHRLALVQLRDFCDTIGNQPLQQTDQALLATGEMAIGVSELHLRRLSQAKESFDLALAYSRDSRNRRLEAHALINQALYFAVRNTRPNLSPKESKPAKLIRSRSDLSFQDHPTLVNNLLLTQAKLNQALAIGRELDDSSIVGEVRLGMARSHLRFGEFPEAADDALEAYRVWIETPSSTTRDRRLLSITELLIQVSSWAKTIHQASPDTITREAQRILVELSASARGITEQAYIAGYLAECAMLLDAPLPVASDHNRRARLLSASQSDSIASFLWLWQRARILEAQDSPLTQILEGYAEANRSLAEIKTQLAFALSTRSFGNSFREQIGPFFQRFAELQLEQGGNEYNLRAVTELMEQAKEYELNNYFLTEDCEAILDAQAQPITPELLREAALIYYVMGNRSQGEMLK